MYFMNSGVQLRELSLSNLNPLDSAICRPRTTDLLMAGMDKPRLRAKLAIVSPSSRTAQKQNRLRALTMCCCFPAARTSFGLTPINSETRKATCSKFMPPKRSA